MASDRDALVELVLPIDWSGGSAGSIADAVIAAGWRPPARRIETPAELDALQPAQALLDTSMDGRNDLAAVIRDGRGRVFTRDMDNLDTEVVHGRPVGWWETGTDVDYDSSAMTYPVTVLYVPTEALACPHDSRSGADGRWRCDQCGADCGPNTYLTPTEEG